MQKRLTFPRVLLDVSLIVIGVPFEGTAAMATEKKTAVPFCSIKNLTKRSVILPSTVGGHSGTSLIFTNHGSTACSLSGILRAQPVVGSKHTPVGPYASTNRIPGSGGLVILPAGKGVAYVLYMTGATQTYPKAKCVDQNVDGLVVTFHTATKILLTLYFALEKNKICTKLQSTSITGVVAGTGGY
jgi:hypothetical protein